MKLILAVVALATLGGCAVYPAAPPMYGVRAAPAGSYDPYQWHTVGPGADGAPAEYASQPAPGYAAAPVYAQPVYAQPVYAAPLYAQPAYPYYAYPPVTIGLDFMVGGWCCGNRGGWGRRGFRGR